MLSGAENVISERVVLVFLFHYLNRVVGRAFISPPVHGRLLSRAGQLWSILHALRPFVRASLTTARVLCTRT